MIFAVVDDEVFFLNQIEKLIKEIAKVDINIECFESSEAFLEQFSKKRYEACFLDIDMPEIDGFELSELLRRKNPDVHIIFITGKEDLVYNAFRYKALGFVRKRNIENDLQFAYDTLISAINSESQFITVTELRKLGGKEHTIPVKNINYIQIYNHNSYIHLLNKDTVVTRNNLSYFCELDELQDFLMIDSGTLVNPKDTILNNHTIILKDGHAFTISRRKLRDVKDKYLKIRRRLLI